jgi:uncharacterized membrane protein
MTKTRLEAFSDGVLAVAITVMVLELKAPHGTELAALRPLVPVFLGYVLSFVYLGIYWNNHHHMLHAAQHVNGRVLWANLHLLFWLTLVPFVTTWVGEDRGAPMPTAIYGGALFMAAIAFTMLKRQLIAVNGGEDSELARAVGRDFKGQVSLVFYVVAVGLAFVRTWLADALFVVVALIWLAPDPRIERTLKKG